MRCQNPIHPSPLLSLCIYIYISVPLSLCLSLSLHVSLCLSLLAQIRRRGQKLIVVSGARHTVFAGKDSSRALALSSLKAEDCRADYEDLDDKEKQTLADWYTFFSKRYNVVGVLERSKPDGNNAS